MMENVSLCLPRKLPATHAASTHCYTNLPTGAANDASFASFGVVCQCQGSKDNVPGVCNNYAADAANTLNGHISMMKRTVVVK